MITFKFNWFLIIITMSLFVAKEGPIVKTKSGFVKGVEAIDGDYYMYMGIPYAQVNKSNPFGASIPQKEFEGIYEANDDSVICISMNKYNNKIFGQLECLTLNIYVPKSAYKENLLPVMYYIYGGDYRTGLAGRAYYGPRFLVRHDIIIVVANYRGGPYGFFCLDTPDIPGNQGLKDQQTGLEWVYDNIEAFGGDPHKITVCGQSSGAISAHYQYYYNKKDLISKIILASGTAFFPNTIRDSDKTLPIRIAQAAGYNTTDLDKAISFLTHLNPKLVIRAEDKLNITYRPCVEKVFPNVRSFITEHPVNIKKHYKNIPVLIGNTEDESRHLFVMKSTDYKGKDFEIIKGLNESFNLNSSQMNEYCNSFKQLYTEGEEGGIRPSIDFSSDHNWNYPTIRTIKEHLRNGAKVFQYLFTYMGNRNYMNMKLNVTGKSTHGDELGYLFDLRLNFVNYNNISNEDQYIIDVFTTIWANFIKFGDPSSETTDLLPLKWEPVTQNNWYYMNIDSELYFRKRIVNKRMAFWERMYQELACFERGRNNT